MAAPPPPRGTVSGTGRPLGIRYRDNPPTQESLTGTTPSPPLRKALPGHPTPHREPLPGQPPSQPPGIRYQDFQTPLPPRPGAVTGTPLAREPLRGHSPVLELLVVVLVRVIDLLVRHCRRSAPFPAAPAHPSPQRGRWRPHPSQRFQTPPPRAPIGPRRRAGRASGGGAGSHWSGRAGRGATAAPLPAGRARLAIGPRVT